MVTSKDLRDLSQQLESSPSHNSTWGPSSPRLSQSPRYTYTRAHHISSPSESLPAAKSRLQGIRLGCLFQSRLYDNCGNWTGGTIEQPHWRSCMNGSYDLSYPHEMETSDDTNEVGTQFCNYTKEVQPETLNYDDGDADSRVPKKRKYKQVAQSQSSQSSIDPSKVEPTSQLSIPTNTLRGTIAPAPGCTQDSSSSIKDEPSIRHEKLESPSSSDPDFPSLHFKRKKF